MVGREVSGKEHRIPAKVSIDRALPAPRSRHLPADVERIKASDAKRIERLRK